MEKLGRRTIKNEVAKRLHSIARRKEYQNKPFQLFHRIFGITTGSLRSLNKILAITFSPVALGFALDHDTGGWGSISLKQNSHKRIL